MSDSDFSKGVFDVVSRIPKGKVVSYKQVANYLNCKAYRAVANVLKTNKFPVEMPCHRVVNENRAVGGYFGSVSYDVQDYKRSLLEKEGVEFDEKGLIMKSCFADVYDFMNDK